MKLITQVERSLQKRRNWWVDTVRVGGKLGMEWRESLLKRVFISPLK